MLASCEALPSDGAPYLPSPLTQRLFMYILKEVRAFEKARNVCRLCLLDSFGLKRESVYKLMCCYLSLFSLYGCALRCVCVDVLSCCCCYFLLFVFLYICILLRVHKKK